MDPSILIPLAGIGIGGLAIFFGHQRKMMEMKLRAGHYLEENTQLEDKVNALKQTQKDLEERIQHLEAIVIQEPVKPSVELPTVKEHLEQLKTAGRTRA